LAKFALFPKLLYIADMLSPRASSMYWIDVVIIIVMPSTSGTTI